MTKIRITAAILISSILSACAHPQMAQPVSVTDNNISCEQIISGIKEAESYRLAAKEEDRFKPSYMLIFPAIVSVYNMNKAEQAATERREGLMQLAKRQNCVVK